MGRGKLWMEPGPRVNLSILGLFCRWQWLLWPQALLQGQKWTLNHC